MMNTTAIMIAFAAGAAVSWIVKSAFDQMLERVCLKIVLSSLTKEQLRAGMSKVAHKEGVI